MTGEEELKYIMIGLALEKVFEKGYILAWSEGRHSEMFDINTIEEMLEEANDGR